MMYFFHTGGKLLFTSAVYDMHFRAETQCGSRSIHCNVAAADNCHLFALHDRSSRICLKRFHQIASGQIFVCRKYTVGILTGDAHKFRKTCTGADKDCRIPLFIEQLVNRNRFADDDVCLDLYAEGQYVFDFFLYNVLFGKTEFRNAVYQYTACLMQRLENGHIIAHLRQIACTGQTCRAGTDNGYLFSLLFGSADRTDVVFSCPVRYETLQFADGHRFALNTTDTFSFTLAFLRADTTADSGKCAGFADNLISSCKIALFYLFHEAGDIDRNRTSLYAVRIFTV